MLDVLVQTRRSAEAAKRFFKRLLKGLLYVPRVVITDKLKSYGVAQRELLPDVEHRQSRYLNIAEAIFRAASDPGCPMILPAGADAIAWSEGR